jgi:hypothetical protein
MKRRHFVQCTGLAFAGGIQGFALSGFAQQRVRPKELSADLIIVGAGTGGCAAALAAVWSFYIFVSSNRMRFRL